MGKPSKKYLMYFKKYRDDPEKSFYSLFSNVIEYGNFLKIAWPNYHKIAKPCPYIDCPWCQGDIE